MSITYSECVFVALFIQHAVCMHLIVFRLWPVWLYHVLPHCLINGKIFEKKINHKMCALIFSTAFS